MPKPSISALAAVILALSPATVWAADTRSLIPEGATYVSLGSSFAAGPGVTVMAEGSPPQCSQSRDNYARQLARARKLKLIDRSCGGATAVHVLKGGQFGMPAQLDGLTADTRLVTITIGGNDIRYMADLGLAGCRSRAATAPQGSVAPACAPPADFHLEEAFTALAANLRAIAAEVRRRSPQARLVFVDYVTVLPEGAPCPTLPLSAADVRDLRGRAERLSSMTAEAARETGADLIQASELTRNHDACAAEPWVQGFVERREPNAWGPVAYHPLLPAMTAIARRLEERLSR